MIGGLGAVALLERLSRLGAVLVISRASAVQLRTQATLLLMTMSYSPAVASTGRSIVP